MEYKQESKKSSGVLVKVKRHSVPGIEFKEIIFNFLKAHYMKALTIENRKLSSDYPIHDGIAIFGVDDECFSVFDLSELGPTFPEASAGLKAIMNSFKEERKKAFTYFCRFTEVNCKEMKTDSPQDKYFKRTGKIFPGTPAITKFSVTEEFVDSAAMALYIIDEETGEFKLDKSTLITDPEDYSGAFSHFIWRTDLAKDTIKPHIELL